MTKKIVYRWLKVIILVYSIIGIVFYYLQDKIFFHPTPLAVDYVYAFEDSFREVNIQYDEQSRINILQFYRNPDTAKAVVLYFHGNKDNIERYAGYASAMLNEGYEVWMIDYPGFGKSAGEFREQVLYDWALQFYKLARARFNTNSIIIYGKSLGTGIATQLASIRDCKHLILETPYYSFPSIASRWLPVYPLNRMVTMKIPTWQYLQKVDAPVTIFHGTKDGVIPFSNGLRLQQYLKPGSEFVAVPGASHNGLTDYELVRSKIKSILD
ncbi:MAG: alpha/beta fold hydrolase [Chitinophagaceae bacterium]|nr:alpha/beta fold hydrolase [Chitinophagaceae bacterium]